jgi:uncharacterized peroxidase-related enzyme
MPHLPSLPEDAGVRHALAMDPAIGRALVALHTAVLRGPSPLSAGGRELIAAFVSALNACRYCHGVHAETARRFGIDPALLERLVEDPELSSAPERMRPLLALARQLTLSPAGVRRGHVEAALSAGWGETAVHHTIQATALFNDMNRLVEGHGIAGDPGIRAERGRQLHEGGYEPLLRWLAPPGERGGAD